MSWKLISKVNSWREFVEVQAPLRQDQRGKAFELLTELYLQIDPVYRSKLKHVWHESNLPPGVRHKLGLPSPDIGVDLVAQSNTGEYWAIQCKYHHDPTRNLTKNELNSFLDVTTRTCKGKFSTLLAVTSAHDYSSNLEKFAQEVRYCLSDKFQSLDTDFFRQARALIHNQTPKLTKRTPRSHQKTAIKNAVKHFVIDNQDRGKLIHPCGTGKSLIGYWIAEALEAKTIIVALPSLYLVRQTLADWAKESLALQKQMDWIVVCSEATIGDTDKGDPTMRFQEVGVDVTTDVDRIATFLRKRSHGQKVIFTTYQSGNVTARAARKANRIFDVGIFDEAHRTVGQKDTLFSHLIGEENIRIRKRVFMTATERRYQGSSDTVLTMDDVDAYGDTFDMMIFKEALEQKPPILSDYKIVTMVIARSEIQHLIDENFLVKPDKGKWDDDTEARTLAALIALRKAMKNHEANHALTFHNSIAKAEAFKRSHERFNDVVKGYGKVDCFHVSSKISTGERKAEIEKFKASQKALITNAKCLTEGVDVPMIDAVLFADAKRSTIDIVQAAGRALRPADNKKRGYIVVPVLVDEDDPEAADKAFQDILMTLRAMASNDDRIIDYFHSISQGKRPSKSDAIIDFVVPDPVKINLDNFVENIETQTWHRLAKLSWMPFEEARSFVHSLNLNGQADWYLYCRGEIRGDCPKPEDIPGYPVRVYASKGWKSWGDWLGTGRVANQDRQYRPFKQARAFVRSLSLESVSVWYRYLKGEMLDKPPKPEDVPAKPDGVYKNKGWISFSDWLGTGTIAPFNRRFQDFKKARAFVHSLKLKTQAEWRRYCKGEIPDKPPRPEDIPGKPSKTYADKGWTSWGDWLGTNLKATKDRDYLSFKEARRIVHQLNLKTMKEWQIYSAHGLPGVAPKPDDIPSGPARVYKDNGWTSWGDWLGTGVIACRNRQYLPFKKARAFARSLNLKSSTEWRRYCKGEITDKLPKPGDIPADPHHIYADKVWISWGDWLGTGRIADQYHKYLPFKQARAFARSLNLKSSTEWRRYCNGEIPGLPSKPENIPTDVRHSYLRKGWTSWPDWLGKE